LSQKSGRLFGRRGRAKTSSRIRFVNTLQAASRVNHAAPHFACLIRYGCEVRLISSRNAAGVDSSGSASCLHHLQPYFALKMGL